MNAPAITQALLTVSPWNRPGQKLKQVKKVVAHWTALVDKSGNDAWNCRNFMENLSRTHYEQASAHFVVGSNGLILQLVPTSEVAWTSGWYKWSDLCQSLGPNPHEFMLGIEACPADEAGNYTLESLATQAYLYAWLLDSFDLGIDDLIRHYDCCGDDGVHGLKPCPKLFAGPPGSDEDRHWQEFKKQVSAIMGK